MYDTDFFLANKRHNLVNLNHFSLSIIDCNGKKRDFFMIRMNSTSLKKTGQTSISKCTMQCMQIVVDMLLHNYVKKSYVKTARGM